jgi:NAD(P)-dependent dehydrogenase (short-subunit alcohol dehydrogenase family)
VRFSGKKAFVTGASRGIGHAIARAFQEEGAYVMGTHTGANKERAGICHEWITSDFSDIQNIKDCADFVRNAEPDILVNNAGINKIAPFVDINPDDFLSIQQVNVFAPFLLCQAAVPAMKKKKEGRIINISSVWGKISKEHRASYSASKFALDGLTLALAAEHSVDGIIANSIAPGFIDTGLTRQILGEEGMRNLALSVPTQRVGGVDEIARIVLWLASEENTYIAGQNISVDGGFSRV